MIIIVKISYETHGFKRIWPKFDVQKWKILHWGETELENLIDN